MKMKKKIKIASPAICVNYFTMIHESVFLVLHESFI